MEDNTLKADNKIDREAKRIEALESWYAIVDQSDSKHPEFAFMSATR